MNGPTNELIVSTRPARPTRFLWVLVLAALAVAVLAGSALAANLVGNGSFENGGDIPDDWAGGGAITPADKRVCNQSYAGACSFKMVGDGDEKSLYQIGSVSGNAGDKFILKLWTKGKNVGSSGTATILLRIGTEDDKLITLPPGNSGWTLRKISLTATEAFSSIFVSMDQDVTTGKLWFDKVKLTRP
jgi:hypothetical protein